MTLAADTALDHAIDRNNPWLLLRALQEGANPNSDTGHVSPLHFAMHLRDLFQGRLNKKEEILIAPDGIQHIISPSISFSVCSTRVMNARHERAKAETSAHLLLAYGARLDHIPAASPGLSLMGDIDLWQDTPFVTSIVMSAFYGALKREEPLPQWDYWKIATQQFILADDQNDLRPVGTRTFDTLDRLKHSVAKHLQRPQTPVEAFVATTISSADKRRWVSSFSAWERSLKMHPKL